MHEDDSASESCCIGNKTIEVFKGEAFITVSTHRRISSVHEEAVCTSDAESAQYNLLSTAHVEKYRNLEKLSIEDHK